MKSESSQVERILQGETRAVSRALSLVENGSFFETKELLKQLFPKCQDSFVIGITGSPGVGKSTLVEHIAKYYASSGERVGVIAVDPSSPFSGGAILGDRIRMQSLATDPMVFVRSMASRGRLGGVSAAVNDALIVLGAAGYRILVVETVGVGQDEVEIVKTADFTAVVLIPGMGDDIQTIKAGIMEIADAFVINKADHKGTEKTRGEIEALVSLLPETQIWRPRIVETIATQAEGIGDLMEVVSDFRTHSQYSDELAQRKADFFRKRILELFVDQLMQQLEASVGPKTISRLAEEVARGDLDPYSAVDILLNQE